MRLLLCILLQREYREMENFEHSNLSLYVLERDEHEWVLIKNNDTAHLSLL